VLTTVSNHAEHGHSTHHGIHEAERASGKPGLIRLTWFANRPSGRQVSCYAPPIVRNSKLLIGQSTCQECTRNLVQGWRKSFSFTIAKLAWQLRVRASQTADVFLPALLSPGPDASRTREGHTSKSAYRNSHRVKGRFNPFRDSVACTIVMRWQRKIQELFF